MVVAVRRYLVIVCLLLYLLLGPAVAQENKTILDLIELIKGVPLSQDIYSDVKNIKSLAILFLSKEDGNIRNEDYNKFAYSIKKFSEDFNSIFQKIRDNQPAGRKEGVRKAIELRDEIAYLKKLSETSDKLKSQEVTDIVTKEKES